jgi:hypothetical protein
VAAVYGLYIWFDADLNAVQACQAWPDLLRISTYLEVNIRVTSVLCRTHSAYSSAAVGMKLHCKLSISGA